MAKFEKAFYQIYIGLILILFLWTSARIILFPYGVDYAEAPLMDEVRRIESGLPIYKGNLNEPPYIFLNYPPLYPLLVTGVNLLTRIPLFQSGRIISFFLAIISAISVYLLTHRLSANRFYSLLAVILFIGHPYVLIWSSLARVDSMALAFSLVGVLLLTGRKNSTITVILACLCFLIAAYTRHTYILAGPLAGFILLWRQSRRRALLFASLFIVAGLTIFLLLNILTHGSIYYDIIVANVNQYTLSRTLSGLLQFLEIWPLILLVGLIGLFFVMRKLTSKDPTHPILNEVQSNISYGLLFFTLGAVISTLTVGKVGSSLNYFLELITVFAIWFVIAIEYIPVPAKPFRVVLVVLLMFQLIWVLTDSLRLSNYIVGTRWQQLAHYDKLYAQIQSSTGQGSVLSDDFLDLVVISGQPIYYEPFIYAQLYDAGLWDTSGLIKDIGERKFPLIVIGDNNIDKDCCWPAPVVEAINASYGIDSATGLMIFTPSYP